MGRVPRYKPIGLQGSSKREIKSSWAINTGAGLLRVITSVLVCRSAESKFKVAETRPLRSVYSASEAALAAAPSRTPSAKSEITLRTTKDETHFAPRPELWPSAITTETPPFGRSIISTVSPLVRVAYLFIFETAIFISIERFYQEFSPVCKLK
jgi:hypothetical protein